MCSCFKKTKARPALAARKPGQGTLLLYRLALTAMHQSPRCVKSIGARNKTGAPLLALQGRKPRPRIALSCIADCVLALLQPPKVKAAREPQQLTQVSSRRERLAGSWASHADGPSDPLPF
jgi:hypothetical protein